MNDWQMILLTAGAALLMLYLSVKNRARRRRDQKNRAFARKLETVLQSRETVKLVCPEKAGQLILTSRRLLVETTAGFQAIPFKTIKRVQGLTAEYKKTTQVDKMVHLTIKAERDHTLSGTTEEFTQLAKQLIRKIEAQNRRKQKAVEKKNEKK